MEVPDMTLFVSAPPGVAFQRGAHVELEQPPTGYAYRVPFWVVTNTVLWFDVSELTIGPSVVAVQRGEHTDVPHPDAENAYSVLSVPPTNSSPFATVGAALIFQVPEI